MKITIDTKAETIEVHGAITASELIREINNLNPGDILGYYINSTEETLYDYQIANNPNVDKTF
jgi:hypothetical protein